MSLTNSPFWFSSGATSAGGGGTVVYPYSIDQSLRFNGSNSYLNRTMTSGNRKTWTFSSWVKKNKVSTYGVVFSAVTTTGSATNSQLYHIYFGFPSGVIAAGGVDYAVVTNNLIKDTSSWYHIVISVDTTQVIASNRTKIYVNGVNATNTSSSTYPSLNLETPINSASPNLMLGRRSVSNDRYLSDYLAEINFIDGTALDANSFGENINGIWVPKAYNTADGAYGTNGFYLPFNDSSAIGNDESGNGNDWTVNNLAARDVVPDSPTNNFATWNSAGQVYGFSSSTAGYSDGNLKCTPTTSQNGGIGTFAINPNDTQGYYWEIIVSGATTNSAFIGIIAPEGGSSSSAAASYNFVKKSVIRMSDGQMWYTDATNGTGGTVYTTWTNGDIMSVAYKEGKIWVAKNGTWMNSGDPAAGTGYLGDIKDTSLTWYPYCGYYNGTYTVNFGQEGTFSGATTAGGNADANGYGDFKYAVPSGFLAMCSANLPAPAIGPQLASGQQSDDYFEPILYTGNGAVQHIGSGGAQHPIDTTTIANSIRFNDSDSAYLNRTPASAGNRKTWTWSAWIKRGALSYISYLFSAPSNSSSAIRFNSNNTLSIIGASSSHYELTSTQVFSDTSAWYHIVYALDTTQATSSDRIKLFVNGVQITSFSTASYPSLNLDGEINNNILHQLGRPDANTFDGYMAEMYFIDGTALDPTSFGQYGSNGYWIPKAVSGLTYGTNGFYLDFSDNSTASALGTDSSGNANNFSATNVATTDQMGDSPTQNFATFDFNDSTPVTFSEGNLQIYYSPTSWRSARSTFKVSSGKWYWEVRANDSTYNAVGVGKDWQSVSGSINYVGITSDSYGYFADGQLYTNGAGSAYGASYTTGDIIGIALDMDAGTLEFFKNNVSQGIATTGLSGRFNAVASVRNAKSLNINFGADDSFAGNATGGAGAADGNGYGSFYYTPPTGYLALVDDNIPVEGLTGPDFVWIKNRTNTSTAHSWFNTIMGPELRLSSNSTTAEQTKTGTLTSFDYDGFTTGDNDITNKSGSNFVAWTWKAGGKANTFNVDGTGYASMTAAGLTDGTIPLTGLSVNTTAGFSILSWTGNTTNPSTIAHGLSSAPEMIILKNRDLTGDWYIGHDGIGWTDRLKFTATNTTSSITLWNNTAPTDSVFTISSALNFNGDATIAYCFHSVEGFSKAGSYVGNGQNSPNGTFVYTGFRPAFVMVKDATDTSQWIMIDNLRANPYNINTARLYASLDAAEAATNTNRYMELFSNGFRVHGNNAADDANKWNESNDKFIYIAFAEAPFKYANAR